MSNVDDCTLSVQFLNGSSFTLTLPCSTLGRDVQQSISERLGGKAAAGVSLAYHDARLRFLDKNDHIMKHLTLKTFMKTNTIGGGFKYLGFSPLPGEMIQFD